MLSTPLIPKSHLTNALVKLGPLALINQTAAQAPHTRVHHSGLTQTFRDGFKKRSCCYLYPSPASLTVRYEIEKGLRAVTWIQPRRYFLSLRLGRASCSSTWKRSRLPRTKFKEDTGAASLRGKFFLNRACFQEGGILSGTCMWKRRRGVEEEATGRAVEGSRHGFQATILS